MATKIKKAGSKRKLGQEILRHWQLYLFLAVPLAYILIFAYQPMFGVQIAFKNFSAGKGIWGSEWVGFDHFKRFLTSYQFKSIVPNTIILSVYGLFASFPLQIIFALALNSLRNLKFKKFVQTVTYMPHFISTVVLVGMMSQIFNPVVGLYPSVYRLFGGVGYPPELMGQTDLFRHFYVWSGIWQGLGWGTIIYVASLASVDPELHEAAEIDGASRLKRVIHIDLPTILPTASIMLILNSGSIMSVGFEKVYLMQKPLNLQVSEVLSTYVYKYGMSSFRDYSFGSAVGLFNTAINLFLLIIANYITKRVSEGEIALF